MHSITLTDSTMAEDMGFGDTLRWVIGGVVGTLLTSLIAVIAWARGLQAQRVTPDQMKDQLKALEDRVLASLEKTRSELHGTDQSIDERRRWLQELVVDPLQRDLKAMGERITNLQQANLTAINASVNPLDLRVRQLEQDMKSLASRDDLKLLREEFRRMT